VGLVLELNAITEWWQSKLRDPRCEPMLSDAREAEVETACKLAHSLICDLATMERAMARRTPERVSFRSALAAAKHPGASAEARTSLRESLAFVDEPSGQ